MDAYNTDYNENSNGTYSSGAGTGVYGGQSDGGYEAGYDSLTHMERKPEEPDGKKPKKEKKQREKKSGGFLKSAGCGFAFGLCAAVVFCGVTAVADRTFLKDSAGDETKTETVAQAGETDGNSEESRQVEKTETVKDTAQAAQTSSQSEGSLSIAQIAENCMPSIVSITTKGVEEIRSMFGTQQYESQGAGSGIIIGQNDTELLIATNNHVVSGAEELSVCFQDSEDAVAAAKIKGTDPSNDLAIISVMLSDLDDDLLSSIRVATIGDSNALQVGDQVVAIGNALGCGQSVTTGIVSALDREVTIDNMTSKLIQTDAAINPGNSGGALLNMKGELVGINSAKFASAQVEGMGYAIPISTAQPILDNLMNRETRDLASDSEAGYLGVSVQDVSSEATEYYDIPSGAYLSEVEENGAADQAGLKKGDIITKFDGIAITGASELKNTIAYYKQGETVEVVYMRSDNGTYKEQTVQVTLAKSEAIEESKKQELEESAKDGLTIPGEKNSREEEWSGDGSQEEMEEFFRQFFGE